MKNLLFVTNSSVALLVAGLICCCAFSTGNAAEISSQATSGTSQTTPMLAEPPPLAPQAVAMVLSNNAGSIAERIAGIEKLDLTPTQKAQALLLLLPTLNKDGQRQFAHAVARQVDDRSYAVIRRPLLQGQLNHQVLSVFLTDTLKRRNSLKLPLLLDLARTDNHPMQAEARELLAVYLREDHGTNWAKWGLAMNSWLAKNAD